MGTAVSAPESRSQRPRAKRRVSRVLNGSAVRSNVGRLLIQEPSFILKPARRRSPGCISPQVVPDHQQHAGASGLPAHFPSRSLNSVQVRCIQGTRKVQTRSGGRVVSETEQGLRKGPPGRATSWQVTSLGGCHNLLGRLHGKTCFLRVLQASDRSGMRQRQGYTFSIVEVLWRGLLRYRRSGLDHPTCNGKSRFCVDLRLTGERPVTRQCTDRIEGWK